LWYFVWSRKIHERDIVFNQCLWRLISIGKSKYLEFFFPSIVEEYIVDCIYINKNK
jgi:hypothetical protein